MSLLDEQPLRRYVMNTPPDQHSYRPRDFDRDGTGYEECPFCGGGNVAYGTESIEVREPNVRFVAAHVEVIAVRCTDCGLTVAGVI